MSIFLPDRSPIIVAVCCAFLLTSVQSRAATREPVSDSALLSASLVGASLEATLAELKSRGHRISYSTAIVLPSMTLREQPKATTIESLLPEILTPWNLRAVRSPNGDWLIVSGEATTQYAQPGGEAQTVTAIERIDVTASRFGLAVAGESRTQVFMDRDAVERLPHLADDAVRMLKVLPGVAGGDFTAQVNVRGGRRDEALLRVDGAEIHNAFHFRDIDSALSAVDTNLLEGINFITGGMTAEHGDYMSGVIDMKTRRPDPQDDYHHAAGISFVSAYGKTSGNFADGRGSWLASARTGYLDVLLARVEDEDEQLTPRYQDLFAAVNYDVTDRTSVSAHVLLGTDTLKFVEDSELDNIELRGKGQSYHTWLTLDHALSDELQVQTLLGVANVQQTRDASGADDLRISSVHHDFDFDFLDFRQDWSWTWSADQLLRWGFSANRQSADYDYVLNNVIIDPFYTPVPVDTSHAADLDVSGSKFGAYAAWRARLTDSLTAEVGGRWDQYRYPQGLSFDAVSPRFNLLYQLGESNELRAAWGVVHQPQGIHELQVEDNVTNFFEPERAEHVVIGFTHRFDAGLSVRLDLYRKDYSHLRPRFENALDPIEFIPEGAADRVRIDAPEARSTGAELTLRRDADAGLAGWLSITVAEAEDEEGGEWVARSWDQEVSTSFGASWSGDKWHFSIVGLYHTGTPTTYLGVRTVSLPDGSQGLAPVVGPRNGERLGEYARVDMRASRNVQFANSRLSYYLEIINLLNRENPCCVESHQLEFDGGPRLVPDFSDGLPMLPSFGFQFEF